MAGRIGDDNGGHGFLSGGRIATAATLDYPEAVTTDGAGDLVIADTFDDEVQVVAASNGQHYGRAMTVGHIYTVAGDGTAGETGNGTKATAGELDQPDGLTVTPLGIAIASTQGDQVAVLATSTGHEYGVSMRKAAHLYVVVDRSGVSGDDRNGIPAPDAGLYEPAGLATDRAGDLFVVDSGHREVCVVAAITHTVFGVAAIKGDIYTVAGAATGEASGNNGPATSANLSTRFAVAIDTAGNMLIGHPGTANVDLVAAKAGQLYGQETKATYLYYTAGNGLYLSSGDDAPALEAENNEPLYDAVAANGDIAYADLGFGVQDDPEHAAHGQGLPRYLLGRSVTAAQPQRSHPNGPGVNGTRIRVVAAKSGVDFGKKMTAGDVYTIAGGPTGYIGPPTGQVGVNFGLASPTGVTYDHHGNLILSDGQWGYIDVIAATTGMFYGQKMTAGHIYHIGGIGQEALSRKAEPGIPALKYAILNPAALAVDKAGNIVIAVLGDLDQEDAGASVMVIAAKTGTYYQQVMTAGHIYTIAGNGTDGHSGDRSPATAAEIESPYGVAVDRDGDVAVDSTIGNADGGIAPATVRFVAEKTGKHFGQEMTVGDIYTVAGTTGRPVKGYGNGRPAISATLGGPGGLAFTSDGSLIASDEGYAEIRFIAASRATRFGIPMTADDIYNIAGNGQYGRTAHATNGTATSVDDVYGVAVAPNGNLVFDDEVQGIVASLTGK